MGSSHLSPHEDYINMELSSSSSPQIKEFEFQFFSASAAKESAAADLFYRGKLLPLHLPPRRQMVEHLIRTAAAAASPSILGCSTAPCTTSNTPSDSRNISPSQSRRVSCDSDTTTLIQCPTQITTAFFNNNNNNHPTNNPSSPWSKKLKVIKMKMIKHSLLKSSRAFLKSFFAKSAACSDAENTADANKYSRIGRKFATLIKKNGTDDHRRSFSGAISADSSLSSSSSTSFNSSALHELQFLRRSSSAAEIEVSIDAAIAHCKKSMQSFELNCNLSS